jgi:hypothetical protein
MSRALNVMVPLALFAGAMFLLGKFLTWGLAKWDWAFLLAWFVVFGIGGVLFEVRDRKRRRLNELRHVVHPERDLPDL